MICLFEASKIFLQERSHGSFKDQKRNLIFNAIKIHNTGEDLETGDAGFGAGFATPRHRTAEESTCRASAGPLGPGNSPYSASMTLLLCCVLPGFASVEHLLILQSLVEMPSQQPHRWNSSPFHLVHGAPLSLSHYFTTLYFIYSFNHFRKCEFI